MPAWLTSGDLPERLRKAALLALSSGLLFVGATIAMESLLLWDEAWPRAGWYAATSATILAGLHYHRLRLIRAIRRWRALREGLPDLLLMLAMAIASASPETVAVIGTVRFLWSVAWIGGNTGLGRRLLSSLVRAPAKATVLSFLLAIALGTLLLAMPRATVDGRGASLLDALFTATSATCVTGLAVLNTAPDAILNPALATFGTFGQVVILLLIQAGGLGIMTLSTSAAAMVGGRMSLQRRSLMADVLDEGATGVQRMIRYIVGMTLVFEALGTAILSLRFLPMFPGDPGRAIWHGAFHAVSAFCNAGFSLFGDSLTRFATDPVVVPTIAVLIVAGGLGFTVIASLVAVETWTGPRRTAFRRLPEHVRIVLMTTGVLLVLGCVAILALDGDGMLSGLSPGERVTAAFFQSVSARTAGFNTVDIAAVGRATMLVFLVLMFIGASPGGTGGGIKTTTFALVLLATRATLRGRQEVEAFGRTIPQATVQRAAVITLLFIVAWAVGAVALLASQDGLTTEQILFETTSAIGTVGLSMNATTGLDSFGKVVITFLMFLGRIGPLTLTLALGGRAPSTAVRYPEGKVIVG
jgi:trk system potassium uptake protein TrkH